MRKSLKVVMTAGIGSLALTGGVAVAVGGDAGQAAQASLEAHSVQYFGVVSGLGASSTQSISRQQASENPLALATLSKGLSARVVTAGVAPPNLDMGALWPATDPRWIVSCNEQLSSKPSLVRTSLDDGHVETIVKGLLWCDPAHTTAWGTLIFGEEANTRGGVYEILDPGQVTNATIDRHTGVSSVPQQIVRRDALGYVSFEGIATLPSGVAYYGDELSPSDGAAGGSYFKFVPSKPWDGGTVASLSESPLADGEVYGLRIADGSNFGQGMNSGDGTWVGLDGGQKLRPQARDTKLTGFYRPEDLSIDEGALHAGQVRWCTNTTGREEAHYYGETICVTDGTTHSSLVGTATPQAQVLVSGSPELNMPDNIAYQPGRGNWILHEDGDTTFERPHNNDLWSCLGDGQDADLQSDGCLRIGTLNDLTAEWTGGFFDPTGTHFYVSIQHNITGYGVLLDITGWH
ncbi:MAG: alkaline phosphatase PhoX [Candidatus Nanopelagicales bacterium]